MLSRLQFFKILFSLFIQYIFQFMNYFIFTDYKYCNHLVFSDFTFLRNYHAGSKLYLNFYILLKMFLEKNFENAFHQPDITFKSRYYEANIQRFKYTLPRLRYGMAPLHPFRWRQNRQC